MPCCATPEAIVGNLGRDRSGMDLLTIRICIIWHNSFTPDALPAATLPIYPGLGLASRNTGMCFRWLGSTVFLQQRLLCDISKLKNNTIDLNYTPNIYYF